MADEELNIRINANSEGVQQGTQQASEAVGGFEDALGKLQEKLLEVFAFEKVKAFVEEAITGFAKVERGMDILGAQIRQHNGDWGRLSGVVTAFMESEERLYGFNKEQMLPVLNDLELKTGNIQVSMKLLDDAAKLAALGIGDLRGNADNLALAFQGNSRGLMALGKSLALTKDQSKDAGLVFDTLAKKLQGVESVLGDTQGAIDDTKAGWADFKEYVGGTLAPLLSVFGALEKAIVTVFQTIFLLGKEIVDLFIIAEGVMSANLGMVKEGYREMKEDVVNFGKDFVKVWSGNTEAVKVQTDKQLMIMAIANKAKADARVKDAEDEKKRLAELLAENKRVYDQLGKEVANTTAEMTRATIQAVKEGKDAWKALGEAMAKYVIEALGKQVEEMGHAKLMEAAAASLDPLTAAAAPGMLASGIALEAAGGVIYGAAEVALAEGGIVNKPTIALIGEKGPEKVTPLGGQDDSGGVHFHGPIVLSFPGVTRASDFTPSQQQNAARSLLATADEVNRRSGKRQGAF